jgi:uncharacterized lipoprotein YddW (UPF0748 family)
MRIRYFLSLAATLWAVAVGLGGCASAGGWGDPYPPEPRREYRGMWVATVSNIDWPSKPGLSAEQMRTEMTRILDTAARLHLNAIFLQVRPSCDAIYPSEFEPWTEYLTGTQGTSPGFDPLAEWIDGAHTRGIELHAWFNPFRARQAGAKSDCAASHVSVAHPELVKRLDKELWLDPGEPEAREHSLRVILDVVHRYAVDGVHFDDYFYPYPKKDLSFSDEAAYAKYAPASGGLSLADWRRDNINRFVERVYQEVHREKPWVRVGISPFGIWRPDHPKGVKGFDAYEGLYADSLRWLNAGWVDYLAPQLYWKIDSAQPHAKLLDWWLAASLHSKRRPILVGNFTSKVGEKPEGSKVWGVEEVLNQVTIARDRAAYGAAGNIHFSAVALTQNRAGIADALARGPYAEQAIPPEMRWLASGSRPSAPRVDIPAESSESIVVRWSGSSSGGGLQRWVLWTRCGGMWSMRVVSSHDSTGASEAGGHVAIDRQNAAGELDRVAVAELDACGRLGSLTVARIAPAAPEQVQAATVNP